ncbi:MAG: hypothetical protein JWM53_4402 [bacterium]|nr:hypothetical protein [bacterium]
MRPHLPWIALALTLAGVVRAEPPFERTEQRAACANYVPTRQPLFGELHMHTVYSADASTLDTRNTPRDAYAFAKGNVVGIPPFVNTVRNVAGPPIPLQPVTGHPYCLPPDRCEYTATRQLKLDRPLDFTAVTDHAEWLGEDNICFYEATQSCTQDSDCPTGQFCAGEDQPDRPTGAPRCVPRGYRAETCRLAREDVSRLRPGLGAQLFGTYVLLENPMRFPFCKEPGNTREDTCTFNAGNVWQQIISDAEGAYDRSRQCSFTSFVAYEYTSMPGMGQCAATGAPCFQDIDCGAGGSCLANSGGGNNLHRNIIFRNANVPDLPISYVDVQTGCGKGTSCRQGGALASPVQMLETVRRACNRGNNCDFLSIPHNSNLSGGAMFLMPESEHEAAVRGQLEPLVEIFQIKGGSECRFSTAHPGAWGTVDELCDFENMSFAKLGGRFLPDPLPTAIPPGSYVRNALELGIAYAGAHRGLNPFQLGFVGSTDTHDGTPGQTEAPQYAKTAAHGDNSFAVSGEALNEAFFLGTQTNGGGLTVAWAEENSRDSIFGALQRRETYATSGTRPIVRFFGGFGLPRAMCTRGDFAGEGYARGVPMGGTLDDGGGRAPSFAVSALRDARGTLLSKVQIIKGWVDARGQTHEQVYDVAGDATPRGTVDELTCKTGGRGHGELCAVWTDPRFRADERAFYYARVLENPSCRWNQYYCRSRGVDCSQPSHADDALASYTQFEYQQCCAGVVPTTVQQRAWTSPIWYVPGR